MKAQELLPYWADRALQMLKSLQSCNFNLILFHFTWTLKQNKHFNALILTALQLQKQLICNQLRKFSEVLLVNKILL